MDILNLHQATPHVTAIDPRGLVVRGVAYWRSTIEQVPATRVTRQVLDAAGRAVGQWDARLSVPALGNRFSLSGKVLASDSVDAGWRVLLHGQADEVLSGWDGRGSRQDIAYDSSLRPVAVTEQVRGAAARVGERFEYGAADNDAGNQCGRVIRHDDPAGTRHMPDYDLSGLAQCEISHFLDSLDPPDWPLEHVERDDLLETGPGLVSRWAYNPLGDLLSLTDAKDHRRHFSYSVAGQLKDGWLQAAGSAAPGQRLVHDIRYNPAGQVERETAGNGVVTEAQYDLRDGRLLRLSAGLPNRPPLQDLRYTVDPVGNILQIDDCAQPVRYYKNQRIEARCAYGYDTLGQLTVATGWEAERSARYPTARYRSSTQPDAVLNYQELYDYDAAGNMTELRHLGAQPFTRRWVVESGSNRSLLEDEQLPDFASCFDDNGNLQCLQRGQVMTWDLRNQLSSVSPVVREDEDDDSERYLYGGGGKRLRKVRTTLTAARRVIAEVRYLPGLELHRRPGGKQHEVLDLEAGRNRVTWLHGPDAPAFKLRYHLTDHLGSGTMELDDQGHVQSREAYYPFGGTAWEDHSDRSGGYKTIRYSGKERDATGLYYYGYRYYAPWLSRWINPDPAGAVDGLNLYGFVGNSPVGRVDRDGRVGSLFGDDSQESLPSSLELMAGSSGLIPIDISEGDFNSQASTWSVSDIIASPRPEQEALLLESWSTSVQPASSPLTGPSSVVSPASTKRHICPTCSKVLPTPSKLTRHMRSHTGEKPYACTEPECTKAFAENGDLIKHQRTHSGATSYVCGAPACGKVFSLSSTLVKHRRTHTGEKPYICTVEGCAKAFSVNSSLARHQRSHTGERSHACTEPGCSKIFTRLEHRNTHAWTHRPKDSCPVVGCYIRKSSPQELARHLEQKHPGWQP
jgi:insecticidal toxin complex protein TccC